MRTKYVHRHEYDWPDHAGHVTVTSRRAHSEADADDGAREQLAERDEE